jgi:hypothetical protein
MYQNLLDKDLLIKQNYIVISYLENNTFVCHSLSE